MLQLLRGPEAVIATVVLLGLGICWCVNAWRLSGLPGITRRYYWTCQSVGVGVAATGAVIGVLHWFVN